MTGIIHDISKQLVAAKASGFNLQDQHAAVNMGNLTQPELLTILMGGGSVTNKVFGQTNVFQYDETKYVPQLVSGKAFTERGKDIEKQKAKTRYFEIGSKGIRLNVSPEDYDGRRKPGSTELMTEADVLANQITVAMQAFDLETELEYAQLLTAGTNRTAGGPFTSYDFHNDILGSTRPAATAVTFSDPQIDTQEVVRKTKNKLQAKAASYGLRVTGFIVICGDNFMDKVYEVEKQTSIARELRSTVDLVSQAIPTIDSNGYRFDNFYSEVAGVTYIRYGSQIIGATNLVGTNDAYMIPMLSGASLVTEAYAPAKVRGIVNTQAQAMYSWFYTDDFEGVTGFYESNKLSMLPRPDLITAMVVA